MSEPTKAVYEAAALAYDEAVNAALRNPPGTVLGIDGRAALIANPAFRAAMNTVWAEGRRQAAAEIVAVDNAGVEKGEGYWAAMDIAAVQVARPPVTFVHPCGHSQVSPIPHLCPQCGTTEPWS